MKGKEFLNQFKIEADMYKFLKPGIREATCNELQL